MRALQKKLISLLILALPYAGELFTLDTVAVNVQVGCVILQNQPDSKKQPSGYWLRSLTDAKQTSGTTGRECLEFVWSIQFLCSYLEGTQFTIQAEHDSCRWMLNIADATGRLTTWWIRLSGFDFDVLHHAGIRDQASEVLSPLRTDSTEKTLLND